MPVSQERVFTAHLQSGVLAPSPVGNLYITRELNAQEWGDTQGGDQAEGTCPLCRANLSPAKIYTVEQLRPSAPFDIEEEAAALEASKTNDKGGSGGDWFQEQRFVSSSKLDAVMRLLEQYCACATSPLFYRTLGIFHAMLQLS